MSLNANQTTAQALPGNSFETLKNMNSASQKYATWTVRVLQGRVVKYSFVDRGSPEGSQPGAAQTLETERSSEPGSASTDATQAMDALMVVWYQPSIRHCYQNVPATTKWVSIRRQLRALCKTFADAYVNWLRATGESK